MEVKIGIQHSPRELVIDVELEAAELEQRINDALANGTTLALEDAKGRKVLVPAAKLAYIEVGASTTGHVGFLRK